MDQHTNATSKIEYQFPDADLIPTLVREYFEEVNVLIPLLHRPTFEKEVVDELYLRDQGFAIVFLLVCAVGARYVDDQRVRLDGESDGASAGWKWFNQIQMVRKSVWAAPRLLDIQMITVRRRTLPRACAGSHRAHVARGHVPLWLLCAASILVCCRHGHSICSGRWRPSEKGLQHPADAARRIVEARVLVRRSSPYVFVYAHRASGFWWPAIGVYPARLAVRPPFRTRSMCIVCSTCH